MEYYFDTNELLMAISDVIDIADEALMQHQLRTTFIAVQLAQQLGISEYDLETLFLAGILHDVGAFTIDEKIQLHRSHYDYVERHCVLGAKLYETVDWLKPSAKIVRHHHTRLDDLFDVTEENIVTASQILKLSDSVERVIDKSAYILHQNDGIIAYVSGIESGNIRPDISKAFIEVASNDAFWLDLSDHNMRDLIEETFPRKYIRMDIEGLYDLSIFFKILIDFRSANTASHSSCVSICASFLAEKLNFSAMEVRLMEIAGNLHDIGKLSIPESILEKPGRLTQDEYAIMRQHVYYTGKILKKVKGFEKFSEWASQHHERISGTGYPYAIKLDDITLGARIFAVSDVYAAIREDRPYRKAMTPEKAISTLYRMADEGYLDMDIVTLLHENQEALIVRVSSQKEKYHQEYKAYQTQ